MEKYIKLLEDFKKVHIHEDINPTFMEIAKFPKRENVVSNILAFYFNPNNPHRLEDLLLVSLLEVLKKSQIISDQSSITIDREYQADGKRIDIVIQSNELVIGIENKISADLYNDLEVYSKKLEKISGKRELIKIVLSPKEEEVWAGFEYVEYSKFFEKIDSNLPKYMHFADTKYLIFFLDFMRTIIKPDMSELNMELYDFFQKKIII